MRRKLTSRKLWMSIASFVAMMIVFFGGAESTATEVASLIMAGASVIGYVIGEGLADSGNGVMEIAESIDVENFGVAEIKPLTLKTNEE